MGRCKVASVIWSWNDKTITISPHISTSWGPEGNHSCHIMMSLWKQYRSIFTTSAKNDYNCNTISEHFGLPINSLNTAEVVMVLWNAVSIAPSDKKVAWFHFGLSKIQSFEREIPILVSAAESKYWSAGSHREKHVIRLLVWYQQDNKSDSVFPMQTQREFFFLLFW